MTMARSATPLRSSQGPTASATLSSAAAAAVASAQGPTKLSRKNPSSRRATHLCRERKRERREKESANE